MIVGTAGHIDHGKTSLVRVLTGTDTDRLKEEKARGITIDLGFAYLPGPDGKVLGFVDVPGHERFVNTMVAGASGIDFVLLVVAADDGLMPQTAEHLAIIDLLGIRQGAVALTKTDLVPPERLDAVTAELREVLAPTSLAEAPVVPVSTVTGTGLERLRALLFSAAESAPPPSAAGRFRLAVDRSFTLTGIGTIVTGTVLSGEVAVGDRVMVSPGGLPARVRSIHAQNRPAEHGRAGERCALNLAGEHVSKEAAGRGDIVLDPSLHAPTDRIDADLTVLPNESKAIGTWFPVRLHHASAEVAARLVPLGDEPIRPGERGLVQLVLERPIAAAAGDRFVVRDTSARRTIGGGRFLDLRGPARKRRTPERLAQLAALARSDAAAAVAGLLATAPRHFDLEAFARDRALRPDAASAMVSDLRLIRLAGGEAAIVLTPETFDELRRQVVAALATFHGEHPDIQGIGTERLRLALPLRLPPPFFRAALARLAEDADVAVAGSWVHLPGHAVQLSAAQEALWTAVAPLLGGAERFRPPRVRDIAGGLSVAEPEVRRLLKLVGRRGEVDEVAPDHFFRRETVIEMAAIVRELSAAAPDGFFTAAAFRDRVENGRKVAIQILDFFDKHGATLRRGDLRCTNRHRLDLFAADAVGIGPADAASPAPAEAHGGESRLR